MNLYTTLNNRPFKCRVCGCNEYKEEFSGDLVQSIKHQVRETAEAEIIDTLIGYSCVGCSVTFQDPGRFTPQDTLQEGAKS